MRLCYLVCACLCLSILPASAEMKDRQGWVVIESEQSHADLVSSTRAAIKENGLIVVTQAGPTKAAAARGIEIPGNTVIGAFNNDFAVRLLRLSTPAMIEAPIRFYVTENADGTATLSYKMPSFVLSPYEDEGVDDIAAELDEVFAAISEQAVSR
ncbi:MAG: DUF302 domain-containing protein [Pseudomonadota bacterium]